MRVPRQYNRYMQRISTPLRQDLPPEGQRIWDEIDESRGGVWGPYAVLMHTPELALRIGSVGEYLRFRGKLSDVDRELAILVAAHCSACEFEWFIHEPIAIVAGLSPDTLQAIKESKTPDSLSCRQSLIIEIVSELFKTKTLSHESYVAAQTEFDDDCLIEIVVIAGFYKMLAFVLNAFDVQVPEATERSSEEV